MQHTPESRGTKHLRRTLCAGAVLVSLDLVWVLLTRGSLFLHHGSFVGRLGLAWRLLLLAALLIARLGFLVPRERRMQHGRLALLILLLATLFQFHFVGPRAVGDGMMYYVYVRSLWKDFDLDFTNEYQHYGLLRADRGDLITPTRTGLRRSIFSIGPAVMWSPFFFAGEVVARTEQMLDPRVDLSGYGPIHWNAVALGSLLFGFMAVWLMHAFLRRHFGELVAIVAALLAWLATFLHWYMVHQPTYAHAASAFLAAATIWIWDRDRETRDAWGFFVWGLVIGLAMCVRWQNAVFLVLPAIEFVVRRRQHWQRPSRLAAAAASLGAGVVLGAFPQMVAWKVLYDEWLLRYPPHGAGFVRLDHPFLLETLFSSRHGLLSWTPVLWLGFLGFIPALRRRSSLALPLLVPLVAMTYVNACAGDWWAGASFSNRRFESCLPLLAFGLAAAIEALCAMAARRPWLVVGAVLSPLVLWNLGLGQRSGSDTAVAPGPTGFAELVGSGARRSFHVIGSPMTWPASWLFAAAHYRPPDQYDRLVGRYLFYRQNNLGGRIEVGSPDDALLGEGWSDREIRDGMAFRTALGRARLFAPLDVPERLALRIHARAVGGAPSVHVLVNGAEVGCFSPGSDWSTSEVLAEAALWHREINEVILDGGTAGIEVDLVEVARSAQP